MLALNRIANVTCMRARTLHTHASRCLCSLSSTPLGATFHRTQAQATDSLCKTPGRGRKGLTSISTSSAVASAQSVCGKESAMSKGTVLICLSGADHIRTQDGKPKETGFFLKELGAPLIKVLEAGYDVQFANPTGEAPHMDPLSDNKIWFMPSFSEKEAEKELLDKMGVEKNFKNPTKFSDISDNQLQSYAGVLIPGGHAPMTDLWSDKDMGRILLHFHKEQKPTATMCHGPIALLSTKVADQDSPWAYDGYEMTCYSNTEEKTNELLFGSKLQFKAEDTLRENGAVMKEAFPMMPKVTVDRELITAQQPSSAVAFGEAFVKALTKG
ncbi:hypothetical protein ABBQ32_007655 [Trebouxia sp. C0010 RCD-2024]